jgi:hypothetical protein
VRSRRLNPTIPFEQGDFRRLPALDHAWAGIVALYSIIHLPREEVTPTLGRVASRGNARWLASPPCISATTPFTWRSGGVTGGFRLLQTQELVGFLEAADWHIEETTERDPYPGVETQTRRVYILANPSGAG